jgi:hypothetical protein
MHKMTTMKKNEAQRTNQQITEVFEQMTSNL